MNYWIILPEKNIQIYQVVMSLFQGVTSQTGWGRLVEMVVNVHQRKVTGF